MIEMRVICLFQNRFVNKLTEKSLGTGTVAQLVKNLPSLPEALGSIPSTVGNQLWWHMLVITALGRWR